MSPIERLYKEACETPTDINEHLPMLYILTSAYDNVKILELGVRSGQSTTAFLYAAETAEGELFSIDVNPPRTNLRSPRWNFLCADDMSSAANEWAKQNKPYDVLFIDTSHYFAHTLFELKIYGAMVRSGGMIFCHDTEWEAKEVTKALDVYCQIKGIEWENIPNNNGMGVITLP